MNRIGFVLIKKNCFHLFRPRKRFCHRPSLNPEQSQKSCDTPANNAPESANSAARRASRLQLKRDSKSIINDDETTTDWTPEIPFRNVKNVLS